jgi:hypothetical protein
VPAANAVAKLARSFGPEALATLVKIMRDSEAPGAVRIRAVEALLTGGFGLPTQPIDVTISRVLAKKLCECTGRAPRRRAVSRTSRAPFRITALARPPPCLDRRLAVTNFVSAFCHGNHSTLQRFFAATGEK